MFQDTVIWVAIVALVAALGVAYAIPQTRPYAKKYGWVLIAFLIGLVAVVLLRRKGGRRFDDAMEEGQDIADQNMGAIDLIIDRAYEESAKADVELARRRLEQEGARERLDAELAAVSEVEDSLERRKALIKISEKYS